MRRVLASLALLLSVTVGLALGQEKVRFEARQHLEGWEDVSFSEFSDLYDLKAFEAEEGKILDLEALARVRDAWAAEGRRVEALLAAERAEPKRWALFLLERKLKKHELFSKIGWTRLDDVEGFVVYVQAPEKGDSTYATVAARENVSRVLPLREHFRKAYVELGGLTRREDFGAEVLFVLSSLGDMQAYDRLSAHPGHYEAYSHYDAKLRAALLLEEPFETSITAADKKRSARHAYAHLLLHAYDRAEAPLQQDWLHEGLATYLADLADAPGGALSAPDTPKEPLQRLVAVTQDPKTVLTHFERVPELFAAPTYMHVATRIEDDAQRAGIPRHRIDFQGVYLCRGRESRLLVDFLHRAERGAAFPGYLARELAGEGGLAAFQAAFGSRDEEALDRAFLEFLFAEHRRLLPQESVNAAAIEAILAGDAALLAGPRAAPEARAAGGAPRPEIAESVEPADLAPRGLCSEAVLALALDLARRGRSGEAERGLAGHLSAGAADEALRPRIERERERLGAWNRLRAAWFADLAAKGGTYKLEHDGKAARAVVKGIEGTRVQFEENRTGRTELDLESLDPLELAREMGREAEALPDGWARSVPSALSGDARKVARGLDPADPAQAAYAADLEADYDALLARGLPLGEMLLLSELPEPRDPASAQAALERLAAVGRSAAACPEVEARLPELRGYALKLFEVVFEQKGTPQLVHGAWEPLPDGRVRLSYGFDDAAELGDFFRADDYLEERRRTGWLAELQTEADSLDLRASGIYALGSTLLVHELGFAAPLSVRYTFVIDKTGEIAKPKAWFCVVGICDDGAGHHAAAIGQIDLEVNEPDGPATAYAETRKGIQFGKPYVTELVHDGTVVQLKLDGVLQQELPTALRSGRIFLMFHADRAVNVKDLVIEGALDEPSVAAARRRWCEERVAELGF